ncbi:MAG TPA: TetR/AcrR family transcriptional regulator [Clostridia bacterium]|nr:TetR/AcrR family transcriptional regulator [Clostridia bacterium]
MMLKKEIQRKRIQKYFIDAATRVIEEEGINSITLRKVSDIAGYNSATLYNYFESVNHVKMLAAMRFIRPYADQLPEFILGYKDAYDKTLLIWKCFLNHAFRSPQIYHAIFFANLNNPIHDYVKEYYQIYPEDLIQTDTNINTMLLNSNLPDRNTVLLEECVEEGFLDRADFEELNNMLILIFNGMLSKIINGEINDPVELLIERTYKYIKICFNGYLKK